MRFSRHHTGSLLLLALLSWILASCTNSSTLGSGGSGINSVSVTDRFNDATVATSHIVPVTASCKSGEQMLSGGWSVNAPAYNSPITVGQPGPNDIEKYFVAGSYPSGPSSWTVIFTNEATGDTAGNVLGVTHVECLSAGAAPTILSKIGATSTPGLSTVTTDPCPKGFSLTGGGYKLTNFTDSIHQMIDFESSMPTGVSQWSVSTDFSFASIAQDGNAVETFAVCANDIPTSLGNTATVTAPASHSPAPAFQPTSGSGYASCGSGLSPIGSGYNKGHSAGTFPLTTFYPSLNGNPPQWDVTAYSLPAIPFDSASWPSGGSAKIIPICA